MRAFPRMLLLVGALGLSACDSGPKGSIGFSLPDGDPEKGKANYIAFQCNTCHSIGPIPQLETPGEPPVSVPLGGETTRIKSYGQLVTSIINPSHRVARRKSGELADPSGQSKMITYNDVMTVSQLIDLVAFVQSSYTLSPYKTSHYPIYYIPEPAGKK